MLRQRLSTALLVISAVTAACGDAGPSAPRRGELILTELAPVNAGGGSAAARDEHGDYDDWIELFNASAHTLELAGLSVSDNPANTSRWRLPSDASIPLAPGAFILLFADDETFQGPLHLPFGLDGDGEAFVVATSTGAVIAETTFPALTAGQSWALDGTGFVACDAPSPGRANDCAATTSTTVEYEPYDWPEPWPAPLAGPIVVSELDAFGDGAPWVELLNVSATAVELSSYALHVRVIAPPEPLPSPPLDAPIPLSGRLEPGAVALVPVAALAPSSGVLVVVGPGGAPSDRVDWEVIAEGSVLALQPDRRGLRVACDALSATPGAPNGPCVAPAPRTSVPPMLRTIGSLADFDALAGPTDETTTDAASVKFIVDRQAGDVVYFVDSARWKLHFDWVWEVVEGREPFDRCTEEGRRLHLAEWSRFSQQNYFIVEGRRFYLGTLIHYRDSDLWTIELAAGDRISPAQLEELFFAVAARHFAGTETKFRPTTARLEGLARQLAGRLPVLPANRPFEGTTLQTLNPGLGYGVLQRVRADELDDAPISYQSIVVLDHLPIELPPVNGSITEALQTPLSHVNVLAQNRGTPNMALRSASTDPRIAPLFGKLVRFEVTATSFDLRVATATEAEAFWEERIGSRPTLVPPRDLSVREIVSLEGRSFEDTKIIGAKAAQYAELATMDWPRWAGGFDGPCRLTQLDPKLPVPRPAFAIPFARYVEHLERSGIDVEIEAFLGDDDVQRDPVRRKAGLEAIRARIEGAPVDPALLAELTTLIEAHYGNDRVRFRSSTNVEDLAGFNGAGLYASKSVQLGSSDRDLADALREVWASVWTFRGYDERALFGVDQREVAMGVLVHRGFPDEEANGVAITTNVVAPESHGFYVNAQVGEISVVQPDGGALPEQLLYKMYDPPEIVVLARS
ncbi:hypothetical protein L6R52_33965, partial [Myxococcota bacterium]|nr:hypothetical protein [Myxococcota bacterium]